MRIRRGETRDAQAVARIQANGWHEAYKEIMPAEYLAAINTDARRPVWEKLLAEGVTLVAEADDTIAGFCSIGAARDEDLDRSKVGEIYALYVDPKLWRNGVGESLCTAGLRWLKEDGFQTASLWVLEGNAIGRRFYEKVGFVMDGKSAPYRAGDCELLELRYVKGF